MGGTAVLVHGAWSSPADWRWVLEELEARGIDGIAVDLPTHWSPPRSRDDDIEAVADAIRSASPPVIAVGWSYGGGVIGDLPADVPVAALVLVASVPEAFRAPPPEGEQAAATDLSGLRFPGGDLIVVDQEKWLATEGQSFPREVIDHVQAHPRRPMPVSALTSPAVRDAWRERPTTMMFGSDDTLIPPRYIERARAALDDVRVVEGDHFLPLRCPAIVADVIAEVASKVS